MTEAVAATDFVSTGLSRDLTRTGSPGVATSLFEGANGTGARTFNGTTHRGARAAPDGDETALQGAAVMVTGWIKPTIPALFPEACIVTYQGTTGFDPDSNTQLSVRIDGSGNLYTRWQNGARVDIDAVGPLLSSGVTVHFGILIDADPDEFNRRRVRFYINGVLTHVVGDLEMPDGGVDARWFLGSDFGGAADNLYLGSMSDIGIYTFVSPEFVRHCYARGVKDWQINLSNVERPFYEVHARVLVEDRLGALGDTSYSTVDGYVDLTTLFGWNWLLSADIEEDADSQAQSASFELITRIGEMSFAPYAVDVNDGTADLYQNVINAFDDLLAENNNVKIEVAIVPYGTGRHGADPYWMLRFDGFIARMDAGTEKTTVHVVDRMGPLQDTWIEPKPTTGGDWSYGSTGGDPLEGVVRQIIVDNDPKRFDLMLVDDSGAGNAVVVDLISLASSPVLGKPPLFASGDRFLIVDTTSYDGEYTVDSVDPATLVITAVETTGGGVAAEAFSGSRAVYGIESEFGYIGGLPEVYVPTSPGWDIVRPRLLTSSQSVAGALEDIPSQIDFAMRFAWDDDRQQFRLTLSRFVGVDNAGVSLRNMLSVGAQRFDKENDRDIIAVEFSSDSLIDNAGNRLRATVVAVTPTANRRSRRRYARIGVASYGIVTTTAEAQEMADGVAVDLANPAAEADVEMLYQPRAVVGGYLTVPGENVIVLGGSEVDIMPRAFSDGAVLGVTRIKSSFGARGAKQTITSRRNATTAVRTTKHRDLIQARGFTPTKGLSPPAAVDAGGAVLTGLSLGGANRGAHVSWPHQPDEVSRAWDYFEVHLSTGGAGAGFTPSSGTLKGTCRATSMVVAPLFAATTYHVKIIVRDRMGNVSDVTYLGSVLTPA